MADWKEEGIAAYHSLELKKEILEGSMALNPYLSNLKSQIEEIEIEVQEGEKNYRAEINECNLKMQIIRDNLIERWDIEGKSYKCDEGSAIIRTTRALKVNDKEKLISTLQQIGKLTQCIKSWDLTYLRKLADADLLDADVGETNIVHYDEKKNVVISNVKGDGR